MAQLNLYVPEDLAARLKREAQRAKVPLSRYVVSLLAAHTGAGPDWPKGYFENLCGFLSEDFPEPDDRMPEPVETIETRR
ncbi:MAG TPA: hypothetical protein VKX45_26670 [Bryobacteraceae bacterium]|jgi:hypothetical protein|nr:hypothetical protein [Bryobacteraceae bacterium]